MAQVCGDQGKSRNVTRHTDVLSNASGNSRGGQEGREGKEQSQENRRFAKFVAAFIQTLQYAEHLEVKKLQNFCRLRLSLQFLQNLGLPEAVIQLQQIK